MKSSFRTALLAAVVSAFVASGAAVATTQAFTLGATNTVDAPSTVTAGPNGITGRLLQLSNQGTDATSTPLGLSAGAGRPPMIVNSSTRVDHLNADLLDGLDSSAFTQGGGTFVTAHRENVANGAQGTLVTIPGITATFHCSDRPFLNMNLDNVSVSVEINGGTMGYLAPSTTSYGFGEDGATLIHALASRPLRLFPVRVPSVLDDLRLTGGWDPQASTCAFQAVAEVFG
jgi:hypothetical protein